MNFYLHSASAATCQSGNDLGAGGISATDTFFGMTGWTRGASTGGTGDGTVVFPTGGAPGQTLPTSFNSADYTDHTGWGDWATDVVGSVSAVMLVLKQDNGFAAFMIDSFDTSGFWLITKTNSNSGGTVLQGISHSSVYYLPGDVSTVPVPAAGLMLMAGLGGLAALRRRRKAA